MEITKCVLDSFNSSIYEINLTRSPRIQHQEIQPDDFCTRLYDAQAWRQKRVIAPTESLCALAIPYRRQQS